MAHPLDGVDAKLHRAIAHIANLEREIRAFTERKPYTLRRQEEPSAGGLEVKLFAVDSGIGDPPVSIRLLAGEVIYQLRSALDHLIHQLVILNGQAVKLHNSRSHQFPIFETREGYVKRAPRMIDGVSKAVAQMVEDAQPYKRLPNAPKQHSLWRVQDLNNTDKHRLIPITVVGVEQITGRESADNTTYADVFRMHRPGPLKDGELIAGFVTRDKHIHTDLACTISFQHIPTIQGPLNTMPASMHGLLWYLTSDVGTVIEDFRRLF